MRLLKCNEFETEEERTVCIFIHSVNIHWWYRHGARTLCLHLLNLNPNGEGQRNKMTIHFYG